MEGKLIFKQGGLSTFSYPDERFDTVVCFKKLNIVPNPEDLLGEIARVLKKDGKLILSFWNLRSLSGSYEYLRQRVFFSPGPVTNEGPVVPFSPNRLKKVLKKMGFELLREEGAKLLPGKLSWLGVNINQLEKRIPALCRTVCVVCRKK